MPGWLDALKGAGGGINGAALETGPSGGFMSRMGQMMPGMINRMGQNYGDQSMMGAMKGAAQFAPQPTMGGRMGGKPMPRAGMPTPNMPPSMPPPQGGMPNIVQGPDNFTSMPGMQPSMPAGIPASPLGMPSGFRNPMDPNNSMGGRMQPQGGGIFDMYRQMQQRMPQRQY